MKQHTSLNWKQNLSQIVQDLEVVLQDQEFEANKNNIDIYFDTADVRRSILGMRQYIKLDSGSPLVNLDDFDRPEALVASLLAGGFLGSFHLLPPHQAEFLRHLKQGAAFQEPKPPMSPEDFLREVGIFVEHQSKRKLIKDLSNNEQKAIVEKQAGNSIKFFKAVQNVRYPWWKRIEEMQANGLLKLNNHPIDYSDLVGDEMFKKILDGFEFIRGGIEYKHSLSHNNFADAVALAILIKLNKLFNEGQSNSVIRFFDSSGLFRKVASHVGIKNKLVINSVKDYRTSVLVGAEYFTYKATFKKHHHIDKVKTQEDSTILKDLHDKIKSIPQYHKDKSFSGLEKIMIGTTKKRKLVAIIDDLVNFNFLENVWLEHIAVDDLKHIVQHLKETPEDLNGKEFISAIDTHIKRTKKTLFDKTSNYRKASTIWINIEKAVINLRIKRRKSNTVQKFNMNRDLDLFRFSLSTKTKEAIVKIMGGLLSDKIEDSEVTEQQSWINLFQLYIDAHSRGKSNLTEDHIDSLQLLSALLWALKANEEILEILAEHVGKQQIPFILNHFFIAASFEEKQQLEKGIGLLQQLTTSYDQDETILDPSQIDKLKTLSLRARGIAYLWFHLAHTKGHVCEWRNLELAKKKNNSDPQELVIKAVNYAHKAVKNIHLINNKADGSDLDEEMRTKQLYSINQWLYYMVEQGDENFIKEMRNAEAELSHSDGEVYWQPTYYDTLARYWLYIAEHAKTIEDWNKYIDMADEKLNLAGTLIETDVAIRRFKGDLLRTRTRGFIC